MSGVASLNEHERRLFCTLCLQKGTTITVANEVDAFPQAQWPPDFYELESGHRSLSDLYRSNFIPANRSHESI